jgi:hypothetical protein
MWPGRRDQLLKLLLSRDRVTVFAHDRRGILFFHEGAGLEARGLKSPGLVGKSVFELNHDWPSNIEAHRRALRGESFVAVGSLEGHLSEIQFTPVFDDQGQVAEVWGVSLNVSERERQLRERDLLIEIGKTLAEPLDEETMLDRFCRLVVGTFADYSLIRLLDEQGQLELVALAHADPRKEDQAFELSRRFTQRKVEHPSYRSGNTVLAKQITDAELVSYALDAQELQALRSLAPRSSIMTPVVARGQRIGVISFSVTEDSGRNFSEADLPMAEELARRVAGAIDVGRLQRKPC